MSVLLRGVRLESLALLSVCRLADRVNCFGSSEELELGCFRQVIVGFKKREKAYRWKDTTCSARCPVLAPRRDTPHCDIVSP